MADEALHHVPTWSERLWRKLGFRYHRNDLPDGIDRTHPGWMITTAVFRFSFWDRVRLLMSGTLHVDIRQATSQQVDEAVNAVSHEIKPPL